MGFFEPLRKALTSAPATEITNLQKSFQLYVHKRGRVGLEVLTLMIRDEPKIVAYLSK